MDVHKASYLKQISNSWLKIKEHLIWNFLHYNMNLWKHAINTHPPDFDRFFGCAHTVSYANFKVSWTEYILLNACFLLVVQLRSFVIESFVSPQSWDYFMVNCIMPHLIFLSKNLRFCSVQVECIFDAKSGLLLKFASAIMMKPFWNLSEYLIK